MQSARLLSVFRQVGADLRHEGPAGGLSAIRTHNLLTLACLEVQEVVCLFDNIPPTSNSESIDDLLDD